jgi:hypothetical protein
MTQQQLEKRSDDTMVVAGYGKLPQGTSVEQLHKVLAIVVLVNRRTGVVLDASTTLFASVANQFVCDRLKGVNLLSDAADFVALIQNSYHGLAQRAVIAAFRDLVRRFTEVVQQSSAASTEN